MEPTIQTMTRDVLGAYGWTQGQLAKELGCSETHVYRMASGRSGVRDRLAIRLVRLYDAIPQRKAS